jgi:hypothetical protein
MRELLRKWRFWGIGIYPIYDREGKKSLSKNGIQSIKHDAGSWNDVIPG